ncbi:MAG: signal peptide peptidase SppA [Deltaproteobacteria bacterium]|nr:signal peptide peptidase SppA [Deltaproteobacteria bacterium]
MFSRRHPYLFFLLVFTSIVSVAILGMSLLFVFGTKSSEFKFGEKIGIIEITGVISDSKNTIQELKTFREDESIKAIILRIDSPGGSVGPAQEIFREITKTVKTKKVVASMGTVAASGGYYIAAAANGIVANPGTITGSIGVIVGFSNYQELLKKIGLVPVVVKSGEYKDIGSPVREMTANDKKILQNLVNQIQDQFVTAVSEGRKMNRAEVESLADGRIFSGEEAKSLGLVDRLGNLDDAIEWAGRMGGIKGKISTVYAVEPKFSLLEYLIGSSFKELANSAVNPYIYPAYLYRPQTGP